MIKLTVYPHVDTLVAIDVERPADGAVKRFAFEQPANAWAFLDNLVGLLDFLDLKHDLIEVR